MNKRRVNFLCRYEKGVNALIHAVDEAKRGDIRTPSKVFEQSVADNLGDLILCEYGSKLVVYMLECVNIANGEIFTSIFRYVSQNLMGVMTNKYGANVVKILIPWLSSQWVFLPLKPRFVKSIVNSPIEGVLGDEKKANCVLDVLTLYFECFKEGDKKPILDWVLRNFYLFANHTNSARFFESAFRNRRVEGRHMTRDQLNALCWKLSQYKKTESNELNEFFISRFVFSENSSEAILSILRTCELSEKESLCRSFVKFLTHYEPRFIDNMLEDEVGRRFLVAFFDICEDCYCLLDMENLVKEKNVGNRSSKFRSTFTRLNACFRRWKEREEISRLYRSGPSLSMPIGPPFHNTFGPPLG